jgi:Domain of unknown function (DUF4136)
MKRLKVIALCTATALLAACATGPEVRTRMAEQVDLGSFHTYGFVPRPGTDTGPYKSLTTQQLEKDVGEALQSRGYVPVAAGQTPDLLVNFTVRAHDRVEGLIGGPAFGWGWAPGWGPWGPWGWGGGYWGGYYNNVQTITTVSLSIDLIDGANKSVVWSGTAFSDRSRYMLDHPAQSIDEAVHQIFLHFPVGARH